MIIYSLKHKNALNTLPLHASAFEIYFIYIFIIVDYGVEVAIQSTLLKKSTNSLKLILSLDLTPAILIIAIVTHVTHHHYLHLLLTSSSVTDSPRSLNTSLRSSLLIYPFLKN